MAFGSGKRQAGDGAAGVGCEIDRLSVLLEHDVGGVAHHQAEGRRALDHPTAAGTVGAGVQDGAAGVAHLDPGVAAEAEAEAVAAGTFLGVLNRSGQDYLISTNYCDFGVSGGPLVDGEGRLIGLTSGGTRDRKLCASLMAETARRVLDQTLIVIDGFPTDYVTNLRRTW